MAEKLQAIQGRCLRVMAGADKATATETLEAEIGVNPLDLYLETTTTCAVARSALSKAGKEAQKRVTAILNQRERGSRRRKQEQRHLSPLTKLER